MASFAPAPQGHAHPAERLRQARLAVAAVLDSPASHRPEEVTSPTPIRPLPDDVGAIVVARADAGLPPAGDDFPRLPLIAKVARPAALLAALDLVLVVVAFTTGSTVLGVVALVLLLLFAAAAVVTMRYVAADPLRIGPRERAAIEASGRWSPRDEWTAPTRERALLAAATDAARRIVATPAWTTGLLARGGVVLSLAAELDQLETQARQTPAEPAWSRSVTRVSALTAYADTAAGIVVDEPAGEPREEDVEVLAFFLSPSIYEVG
ncbi:hypothetical protein SAMN05443575_3483 [Jatrophihabitans endophyticus]|uniref:Uncharacterized protein n=1 Tax=Jatrophihabitans endophyticus TaxID=1206085 RepID=A0A1M5R9D9_9ACTN|nr:hypothetical protein [Jatrophihabitans endophyticus]SHH22945.1 hypothetical protein SAMN05443575_3483 [Jatrophihabitans endophyticus]